MVLHPDRAQGGSPDEMQFRKEKTALVNQAWNVLGNEQKRREYDVRRGNVPAPASRRGSAWSSSPDAVANRPGTERSLGAGARNQAGPTPRSGTGSERLADSGNARS